MKRVACLVALCCSVVALRVGAQSQQESDSLAPAEPPIESGVAHEPAPASVEAQAEPQLPDAPATSAVGELGAAGGPESGDNALVLTPMSSDELDALGIDAATGGADTALNISGFADFTFAKLFVPKTSVWRANAVVPPHSTFYVGSFNLYIRKNLTETLRTLGEVRFSYLPNGSADSFTGERVSTTARDYSDFGRPVNWGAIQIQRLYLEWDIHSLLSIRGGQFLTPYGIWNVDHGTPTYIPVQRPYVLGGWFPERQTGLELLGRWDALADVSFGYRFTLSNGTGPVSEYMDLDENKAIGGRAYVEYRGLGELRIGGSVYYGRETDAVNNLFLEPGGAVRSREQLGFQFDSLAWAADLSWKYRGWHLQSEWVSYQRAYTTRGRTGIESMGIVQVFADSVVWGTYGLIGHRFSWFGVMPFVLVEHIEGVLDNTTLSNITVQAGLNCRPIESLTLKFEYSHTQFFDSVFFGEAAMNMLQAQAAWTF